MKNITLVCFDYALSSVITGILDLFSLTGVSWNRVQGQPPQPLFQVDLVSLDGKPVQCLNRLMITPHKSLSEVEDTDLIMLPPIGANIDKTLDYQQDLFPWLREQHAKGAQIASSCTGTFLLAKSGLLDGKKATTHWGYVEQFRDRFPDVILKPQQLITNEVDLFCAGGGSAWMDLSLFLIELNCGREIALQTAKALIIDRERSSQVPYCTVKGQKYHQDKEILAAQEWMEENLSQKIRMEQVGMHFGMSSRTFKRRFKSATGDSPLPYLQSLRIESAKKLLESTRLSIDEITLQVGYEDSSSFMKLFKRNSGISPNAYRNKFNHSY